MSRTVADATRFTATSPHAFSKPASILRTAANTFAPSSAPSSQTPRRSPNLHIPKAPPPRPQGQTPRSQGQPEHETPRQKVERIRALRIATKANQYTLWDRIVVRGRVWADIAHMITVYFLVGCSIIMGIVTLITFTDIIIYNRRQRNNYRAGVAILYEKTLASAIAALRENRPLAEDEAEAMNDEIIVLKAEAEKELKKEKGWGVKEWLIGGKDMGAEDIGEVGEGEKVLGDAEVEGRGGLVGSVKEVGLLGDTVDVEESVVGGQQGGVMKAVEGKRKEEEKRSMEKVENVGGPLDTVAEGVVEKAKSGWAAWFGGR
ncbi:MAG: hypothetical protein Q9186_000694 [Xanthomendoza sp. 1 TL-2023]